jgi:hypothetical protein
MTTTAMNDAYINALLADASYQLFNVTDVSGAALKSEARRAHSLAVRRML